MRIISGIRKGQRLKATGDIRPTSDKVKGALFNILAPQIEEATFLDLYAGAGAIGIEALSRGAERVVFVDCNRQSIACIRENLGTHFTERGIDLRKLRVNDFLTGSDCGPFDIIFADPPYQGEEIEQILPMLGDGVMLAPSGTLVFEHYHKKVLPQETETLAQTRQYKYGETVLSFYAKKNS